LNANEETTLRLLLGVTNAGTWAFIGKPRQPRLVPEAAMPAERQILQQLKKDPAIGAPHQRYLLWLDLDGNHPVEWITAGAFDPSPGWKQIKAATTSPSASSAAFEDRDYGSFNGQYKLSPTQPVYRLDHLEHPDETSAFNAVGLEKVMVGGDSYGKPLLEVVDDLKSSREGSPLFRAYLILRLVDVMNLQPEAWRLAFCPGLRALDAQIKSVVGAEFGSGDWFVPAKVTALSGKLEALFASVRPISYAKQAGGLLALARAVAKSGLQYAGFVGLEGKPNFSDKSSSSEVWGFSAAIQRPVLLAGTVGMPLSPLFALGSPRAEYLTKAGVNPDDASFQGSLPPLFQGSAQP
jgi:hypothetical protein